MKVQDVCVFAARPKADIFNQFIDKFELAKALFAAANINAAVTFTSYGLQVLPYDSAAAYGR